MTMLTSSNHTKTENKNLFDAQKKRIEQLYTIYLNAMEIAFDEANHYVKYAMTKGNKDLNEVLKTRSIHINHVARKYQEFNLESLAKSFGVSVLEIRKATNIDKTVL